MNKNIMYPITFCALALLFVGCITSDMTPEPTLSAVTPVVVNITLATNTAIPTLTMSSMMTLTPELVAPSLTPTLLPSPPPTVDTPAFDLGQLIYLNSNSLAKIDLGTAEVTILDETATVEQTIGFQNAVLSPDQQKIVYWYTVQNSVVLRLANLENGVTEDLLTFADITNQRVSLFWVADGSHIFVILEPAITPPILGQPTPDPITIRTRYLISVETKEVQLWEWECDRIALSPQTNHIATWCPSIFSGKPEYAVIEWGGEIWFSTKPPTSVLKIRVPEFQYPTWVWSQNGQQVVYSAQDEEIPTALVRAYIDSGQVITTTLGVFEGSYNYLNWSVDQRYISFLGRCPTVNPCLMVVDTETGETVWTSEGLGQVNSNLHKHMWHPNNNLILQPSFVDGQYTVFIIDPIHQSVISSIFLDDGSRLEVGWLP